MPALRDSARLLDNLGQGHLVAGKITATAGTLAALSSNDPTATLTRNAAGDYTVTFGQAFLAAPIVASGTVEATFATTEESGIQVVSVTTTAIRFNVVRNVTTGTVTALADSADFHFMVFGQRDN